MPGTSMGAPSNGGKWSPRPSTQVYLQHKKMEPTFFHGQLDHRPVKNPGHLIFFRVQSIESIGIIQNSRNTASKQPINILSFVIKSSSSSCFFLDFLGTSKLLMTVRHLPSRQDAAATVPAAVSDRGCSAAAKKIPATFGQLLTIISSNKNADF